jgi:hypothetical protein
LFATANFIVQSCSRFRLSASGAAARALPSIVPPKI